MTEVTWPYWLWLAAVYMSLAGQFWLSARQRTRDSKLIADLKEINETRLRYQQSHITGLQNVCDKMQRVVSGQLGGRSAN